ATATLLPTAPSPTATTPRTDSSRRAAPASRRATPMTRKGSPIPVVITIYQDKSFTFEMRTPPVSYFIKKAAKLESGSKTPGRDKAGKITKAQVKEIAEKKMADLNCDSVEAAMRMVEGSARSMGIEVAA